MDQPASQLYKHQVEALEKAKGRTGFAYLMDTRTGKSRTFIEECCQLYTDRKIEGVLLLAPKGVYMNWANDKDGEWVKWCWCPVNVIEWRAGYGGVTHKKKLEEQLKKRGDVLRVVVMNSEALSSGAHGITYARGFLKSCESGSMLGVDESVDFSSHNANRTKALIGWWDRKKGRYVEGLKDYATYRRIMNGLLCPRGPLQVWSQFEILDRDCLGFRTFTSFKNRYALVRKMSYGGHWFDQVIGYRDEEELQGRVARHSYRIRRDECWDLPGIVYTKRNIELTKEQIRIYKDLKKYAMSKIEESATGSEGWVSATVVITQLLRLHQLVCGFVVDEGGKIYDVANNREDELIRVADDTEDKIVIWVWYRHLIGRVMSRLEKEYGEGCVLGYHGGTGVDERPEVLRRFSTDSRVRFLAATSAAAKGVKLTAAGTQVFYANSYSLDKRSQAEDRLLGIDQKGAVNCIDFVSEGTVDEKILHALRNRINLATAVMGDKWKEWVV